LELYSDFVYDSNQNPVIEGLPDAEPKMLQGLLNN
jgi:hypothetical protein